MTVTTSKDKMVTLIQQDGGDPQGEGGKTINDNFKAIASQFAPSSVSGVYPAQRALQADYASNAGYASSAYSASSAGYATNAGYASSAYSATNASYASSANYASSAGNGVPYCYSSNQMLVGSAYGSSAYWVPYAFYLDSRGFIAPPGTGINGSPYGSSNGNVILCGQMHNPIGAGNVFVGTSNGASSGSTGGGSNQVFLGTQNRIFQDYAYTYANNTSGSGINAQAGMRHTGMTYANRASTPILRIDSSGVFQCRMRVMGNRSAGGIYAATFDFVISNYLMTSGTDYGAAYLGSSYLYLTSTTGKIYMSLRINNGNLYVDSMTVNTSSSSSSGSSGSSGESAANISVDISYHAWLGLNGQSAS